MAAKCCTRCHEYKDLACFKQDKRRSDNYASWCKGCHNAASRLARVMNPEATKRYWRQWSHNNKDKKRLYGKRHNLRKHFNISIDTYHTLVEAQGGACAICGRQPLPPNVLCVDHNHKTNQVRKLLCRNCNLAVGNVRESVSIAIALTAYLREYCQ